MSWGNGLLIIVGVMVVLFLLKIIRTKEASSRFGDRAKLGSSEIWNTYYSSANINETAVTEIWREISETLKIAPDIMRPADKLKDYQFSPDGILSPDLDLLSKKAAERLRQLGINADLEKVITVDDYVRLFGSKVALPPDPKNKEK